jgi:hypothetical protein
LSLCSSRNVRDQVSYPYKNSEKIIIFLYFNIYSFRQRPRNQYTS